MSDNDESNFNYNILSRPKRPIHFKKMVLPVKNDTALESDSDSSEDEDFKPENDKILDISSGNSSDNNSEDNSINTDEEVIEKNPKKLKSDKKVFKTTENSNCKDKKIIKKSAPETLNSSLVKKKRKRRTKKEIYGNPMSDEETKKFISSFKNSKIIVKKEKKSPKNISNNKNDISIKTMVGENSGPFIKNSTQKINSKDFPLYTVYQSHSMINIDESNMIKKGVLSKEKIPPIICQKSPWLCVVCHHRPNQFDSLGDLFGPYRISLDNNDEDLTLEFKPDKKMENFKEIWIHEGCAVWTPNILLKDNRLKGISSALEGSSNLKCSQCKKFGASLMCHKHGCKKKFHFPCALYNETYFDKQNFTIYCKLHSTKCQNSDA